jgi:hypothetical protein
MAGCSMGPELTQAQMNALETREVDAGFNETFNAASNALFDAGYTISMSDREGGLLTGTKADNKRAERAWFNNPGIEDDQYTVSIQLRETGPQRCSVRVKTSTNGEPVVNRKAIDQFWVLMQRQVLMKEPTTVAGADTD